MRNFYTKQLGEYIFCCYAVINTTIHKVIGINTIKWVNGNLININLQRFTDILIKTKLDDEGKYNRVCKEENEDKKNTNTSVDKNTVT